MKPDGPPVPPFRVRPRLSRAYRGFQNTSDHASRVAVDVLYDALSALGDPADEPAATGFRDRVVYENGVEDEWWTVLSLSLGDTAVTAAHPLGRLACYAAVAVLTAAGNGADAPDAADRPAAEARLGVTWRAAIKGG